MQVVADLGAQEVAPFFSSSFYTTIIATLGMTVVVLLLMSIMPRMVALLFQRLTPDWIDGVTVLLMVLLLLGQVTIMFRWLWPDLPYLWPLLLLATLAIAALLPANPLSDVIAYLRLRRTTHYQVGDQIIVGQQQGQVVALRPLYTEILTTTTERVRLPNSIVLRRQVVQAKTQPATVAAIRPATAPAGQDQPTITEAATAGAPPLLPAKILPLQKRQGLGAQSIKGLIRT